MGESGEERKEDEGRGRETQRGGGRVSDVLWSIKTKARIADRSMEWRTPNIGMYEGHS